jgi:hypothetical protein
VRCELIETHTTGKGADGDDSAIIEELQKKVGNNLTSLLTYKKRTRRWPRS